MDLFPYQKTGAQWLTTKQFALLADEMGLGKSAQVITACSAIDARKILVICPAHLRLNWASEWSMWSDTDVSLHPKPVFTPKDALTTTNGLICSYNLTTNKKISTYLSSIAWDVVILDEAHYLKNRKSQRSESVLGDIIRGAKKVWALTGTPTPNNASELYPLLSAFKVFEGDFWKFVRRYCTFVETVYGTKITGSRNVDELRSLIGPITLRRKKEEVLKDLPKIMFNEVVVEPGEVDLGLHYAEQIEGRFYTPEGLARRIGEDIGIIEAVADKANLGSDGLAALQGLTAKCNFGARYFGLQKCQPVAEIIAEELESKAYEKIVIFAHHKAVVQDMQYRLSKFKPVTVWGGTPAVKRDRLIKKFQTDPRCRVFVGNIQAAGTGINLTSAHQVAFIEQSWVPSDNAQAAMRVHRIGQTKPVTVRVFVVANSIDQKIQRALKHKMADITKIFDAPELEDPFDV